MTFVLSTLKIREVQKLLAFIVGLAAFLVTTSISNAELVKKPDGDYVRVRIKKGWNLAPSYSMVNYISTSSYWSLPGLQHDLAKAIFVLDSESKKYISITDFYNGKEKSNEYKTFIDKLVADKYGLQVNFLFSGLWIYSIADGNIEYKIQSSGMFDGNTPENYSGVTLYGGWNFFAATFPDLSGKSLFDIKGNCDINKAVFWDNTQQNWVPQRLDHVEFTDQDTGLVIGLKVNNTCKLSGSGDAGIINPPAIPN